MPRIFCFLGLLLAGMHPPPGQCGNLPDYPAVGIGEIQGMDVYAEGGAVHAVLVGKPRGRDAPGVFYLFSKDGGAGWSRPARVDDGGRVVSRRGDEAQVAARGRRVVVGWRQGGELPGAGPIATAYSTDGGKHWRAGGRPAAGDATENQSYLDLAADVRGRFHAVWLDDREEKGNTQGLRHAYSADGGRRWGAESTLDGAVCTCCWNRLAALPDGGLAALYRDDDPHDMRLARLDGGRWRDLGAVGAFDWRFNGCPHCGGGIAAGPGRTLHGVVWSGKEGAEGLYHLRSDDLGGHWTPPLRIGGGESRESDIAVLPGGRVGVVFTAPAEGGEAVRFIASDDAGRTWSEPAPLSAAGAAADHPRIVAGPKGFRVFWTERRDAGGRVWAAHSLDQPLKTQ